jgi:ABC-type bacteriocin/lantibiotic exporter with double-glycine peptidase domain
MENIKSMLKKLSFPINIKFFVDNLTQHPAYPSLRSLSDTFDEWHIPNMAVKISPIQLSEIAYPAIAYCKSATDEYYVLLESYKDEKITYTADGRKEITLSVEEFANIWTGIVLLLAPDENSKHPEAQKLNKQYKIQQTERFVTWSAGLGIILLSLLLYRFKKQNG